MKTNVLLVACYGYLQPPNAEPLSIEILKSHTLKSYGDNVCCNLEILDYRDDPEGSGLLKKIQESNKVIDILGMSIPQSTYDMAVKFLINFSVFSPETLIVLGHSLPTHNPEAFFSKLPKALIVNGWGEESFTQLVDLYQKKSKDYSKVANLIYFNTNIVKNIIKWPKGYVNPTRDDSKEFFKRVESSRGCHYDVCTFCTRPPREKAEPSWFRYPVDGVLDEINELKKLGVTSFTFTDEDFIGNDLTGAERIIDGIKKIGGMRYSFSVRVDNIVNFRDTEGVKTQRSQLLTKLKESGVSLIFLGVESLSNTQLKRYGKGYQVNEVKQAITKVKALGIRLELGYILFDPLLTIIELRENVSNLRETKLWGDVDCLFDTLRIQKDTTYEKLLRGKQLLKQLDNNSMSYDYSFENPEIQLLSDDCLEWKNEIHPVFMLARNIQRTQLLKTACDGFVYNIRRLEYNILKDFIVNHKKAATEGISSSFRTIRSSIVKQLSEKVLRNQQELTRSEQALCDAIEKYQQRWSCD